MDTNTNATVPRPPAAGPEMAALVRFYPDVTWDGVIHAGGMGPGSPAMSTAAATAALASSIDSSLRPTPVLIATSRSRRCRTHTSPLDNRAKSRAASRTRPDISEWSTVHAIEAENLSQGTGLTPLVAAAVSDVARAVLSDIRDQGTPT